MLRENTSNISPLKKKKKPKSSSSKEKEKSRIVNVHDLGEENNDLMITLQETTSHMLDWSARRKEYSSYHDDSPSPTSDGEGSSFHQQRSEQKSSSARNSPVRKKQPQQSSEESSYNSKAADDDDDDDDERLSNFKMGSNFRLRPRQIIYINDYDFRTHQIEVCEGTIVDFRLLDVPNHAEHQLEGRSTVECLRFLSPVLQKGDEESFEFITHTTGEVVVSCTLNTDMRCKIIVQEASPLKSQSIVPLLDKFDNMMPRRSEEPPTITGVGRVVYRGSGYNTCSESYSSGISDSDDELTFTRNENENHHSNSISTSAQREISMRSSFSSTVQIYVEQFAFRPSHLVIPRNSCVEFVPDSGVHATLDCDSSEERLNVFNDVDVDATVNKNFVYKFENSGKVTVKNAIYTFMTCDITVTEEEEERSLESYEDNTTCMKRDERSGDDEDFDDSHMDGKEDNSTEGLKMSISQRRKERRKKAQQKQVNSADITYETDSLHTDELETISASAKKKKKKSKLKNRGEPPSYMEVISMVEYNCNSDSEDRREKSSLDDDRREVGGPAVPEEELVELTSSHCTDEYQGEELGKDDVNIIEYCPPDYNSIFRDTMLKGSYRSADVDPMNVTESSQISPTQYDDGTEAGWCVAEKPKRGNKKSRQKDSVPLSVTATIQGETNEEKDLRLAIEESKRMYELEMKNKKTDDGKNPQVKEEMKKESSCIALTNHCKDDLVSTVADGAGYKDQMGDETIEYCFTSCDHDDDNDEHKMTAVDESRGSGDNAARKSVRNGDVTSVTKPSHTPSVEARSKDSLARYGKTDKLKENSGGKVQPGGFESLLLQRWKAIEPHRGIDILPLTSMGRRKADIYVIGVTSVN